MMTAKTISFNMNKDKDVLSYHSYSRLTGSLIHSNWERENNKAHENRKGESLSITSCRENNSTNREILKDYT